MALNLDAIGKRIGPFTKDYTWKDAVLYALGVGAGFSDLDYCYEKNLKVIPSFGINGQIWRGKLPPGSARPTVPGLFPCCTFQFLGSSLSSMLALATGVVSVVP